MPTDNKVHPLWYVLMVLLFLWDVYFIGWMIPAEKERMENIQCHEEEN